MNFMVPLITIIVLGNLYIFKWDIFHKANKATDWIAKFQKLLLYMLQGNILFYKIHGIVLL